MARIKQLSLLEAQKIAAGEVVERPANVVKELVENSLDAGATTISIYVEDGGRQLIRVIDNGYGMSLEDARMCIRQHATSKITSVDDLIALSTFGFRGEALSSIGAISALTLITKEEHEITGTMLSISQSIITHETSVACNTGTDITVKDIFFNVPARKKFLKTRDTEWRAISQLLYAFTFAYPHVNFKLYHDEKLIYNCPATDNIKNRMAQIYDRGLTHSLLEVDNTQERMNMRIAGVITDTQYVRYDRSSIFMFVNRRWVKNTKLIQAFIKGYQRMLPPDKYPAGVISISLDSQYVDINIHPRKEEVQFLHPRIVEQFLEDTIKKQLEEQAAKKLGSTQNNFSAFHKPLFNQPYNYGPNIPNIPSAYSSIKIQPVAAERTKSNSLWDNSTKFSNNSSNENLNSITSNSPEIVTQTISVPDQIHVQEVISQNTVSMAELEYTLIGQLQLTYILIETAQGLTVIDQHAAHERIMYEKLRSNFDAVSSIKLLFPQVISLLPEDLDLILNFLPLAKQFGLLIEPISASELVVQETPVYLKNQPLKDLVLQLISWVKELRTINPEELRKKVQEKLHAQISCKAAVKAGDVLTPDGMKQIITDLYKSEHKLTCPHGRPTIWLLTEYELKKKFKRDYPTY